MSYFKDLIETFSESPWKIMWTAFLLWTVFPVIIFGIYGGFAAIFTPSNFGEVFSELFINAILPWWVSVISNFWQFLLEYLVALIITLILVNHDILEPTSFNFKVLFN